MTTCVTLFAGAGGADLGLRSAGVQHVACVDSDPDTCATLRAAGFPAELAHVGADFVVRGVSVPRFVVQDHHRNVDLVWASPPCQPWSRPGKRMGAADHRNAWPDFLDALDAIRPRVAIVENVPSIPRSWLADLEARFPDVQRVTLDAAELGVPQRRNRVFLVATPWPVRRVTVMPREPRAWVSMGAALPGLRPATPELEERYVYVTGGRAATEPWRLDLPAPTVTTTEVKGTRACAARGWTFNGGARSRLRRGFPRRGAPPAHGARVRDPSGVSPGLRILGDRRVAVPPGRERCSASARGVRGTSRPGGFGMTVNRVISGGQTGADQGGIWGARSAGLSTGGFAPRGWRTDAGPAPWLASYGLVEHPRSDYPSRTVENVRAAVATLIYGDPSSAGCRLTIRVCTELHRPYYVVHAAPWPANYPDAVFRLRSWLAEVEGTGALNIAGNRERLNPGICAACARFVFDALGGHG